MPITHRPDISLLCAVHNEARYLPLLLDSVRAQHHPCFELILVDDRSTDETSLIAHEAASRDPRIVVVPAETSGKNSAWNAAYTASRGAWIGFIGGDDLIPVDGVTGRLAYTRGVDADRPVVVYSKVRMFGDGVSYDGLVVPRGRRGSRSGPTAMLSRALAEIVFPIAEDLPNEDLWVSTIADLRAEVIEAPQVCFEHRSHQDNSFRRGASFEETSAAFAARARAFTLLLQAQDRFDWTEDERAHLSRLVDLEEARREGRLGSVLRSNVPWVHRLRIASQTDRRLFAARTRAYRLFSGW